MLFLESYLRTIKATPGLEGISLKVAGQSPGDPIVSSLGYIDDVGVLSSRVPRRLHQLRLLLKVTLDWSKQWGIRVSVGTGKTEIVAFIPPALRTSFACPDSITVDGVTVDFSREYKYLGWVVNRELSDDKRELDIIRNATREYGMNIASVKPVKNGPPLTVLQFFKTFVMSIAANMASIFKPSNELCAQIDKLALNAARLALPGFPRSTPAPILFKMTGLVPFRYIALLHRIRLFLFLTNPANAGCLSAQVYRVLELEKQAGSWYCETRDIFKALGVDVTELSSATSRALPLPVPLPGSSPCSAPTGTSTSKRFAGGMTSCPYTPTRPFYASLPWGSTTAARLACLRHATTRLSRLRLGEFSPLAGLDERSSFKTTCPTAWSTPFPPPFQHHHLEKAKPPPSAPCVASVATTGASVPEAAARWTSPAPSANTRAMPWLSATMLHPSLGTAMTGTLSLGSLRTARLRALSQAARLIFPSRSITFLTVLAAESRIYAIASTPSFRASSPTS